MASRSKQEAGKIEDIPTLQADCSRCAALCCVAYAFDRSQGFAIDKPNGVPCPHLEGVSRCRIYPQREEMGFGACAQYDCHGAGQRVTQEVFDGKSWREEPQLLPRMVDALISMRTVHELILLLNEARAVPLTRRDRLIHRVLMARLVPAGGWSEEGLLELRKGKLERCVRRFLKSLRRYFADIPA